MNNFNETTGMREMVKIAIKETHESFDAYISDRGIDLFLEELKNSHEQMIMFALVEYMHTLGFEYGPPEPRDLEAIIIKWYADRQVNLITPSIN